MLLNAEIKLFIYSQWRRVLDFPIQFTSVAMGMVMSPIVVRWLRRFSRNLNGARSRIKWTTFPHRCLSSLFSHRHRTPVIKCWWWQRRLEIRLVKLWIGICCLAVKFRLPWSREKQRIVVLRFCWWRRRQKQIILVPIGSSLWWLFELRLLHVTDFLELR